ncbi:MAG: tRNA 2-thiouridine(34) synthase MnmA [Oscillospiraceae bacterium]|nr:tRNA 2-thiouridine(34) synthase MnmA [Oscillospiraceae bacterium]
MKKKVLIGMSGGVDSSVAAHLLMRDYDVIGVTLLLHGNDDSDAKAVCKRLGIEHFSHNAERDFSEHVIKNFTSEYLSARTPNPCVLCNYHIKFGTMLELAEGLGIDFIATGHYSRLLNFGGELFPARALHSEKDQTYALYRLNQKQLSHSLFPLGALKKSDVRAIAEEIGLSVAEKSDSQDICFIPDGDYASYIEKSFGTQPHGIFRGPNGENLGEHKGLIRYTVGQRRGLGIAYSERLFVSRLDAEKNEVVLGTEGCQSKRCVSASDITFISKKPIPERFSCTAKIRYNAKAYPADITVKDGKITAVFEAPQRGVCPGQSLVLYDGDRLLGGGIIDT